MSAFNPTNLPDRLVRELLETAEQTENGVVLNGREVRKILEELGVEWTPYMDKGQNREEALRSFKRGVRLRYGTKNVTFSMEVIESKGKEHDYLVVSIRNGWPQNDLFELLHASGLSRYFEQWGAGCGGGQRDITFGSKKGRKVKKC